MMRCRGLFRLLGQGRLFGAAAFLGVGVFWTLSSFSVVEAAASSSASSSSPAQAPTATATATATSTAPKPCPGPPEFDADGNKIEREGEASCPTEGGLGECKQGVYVEPLNRDSGSQLHNMVERHTDGGFTVTLILNCRASKITWSVINNVGRPVPGVSGVLDQVKFDEVDWVYSDITEYKRYETDGPDEDGDGSPDYLAGDIILDDNGHAVVDDEKIKNRTRYKAYRSRFDYKNAERTIRDANGDDQTDRPLEVDQVYSLRMEIEPYSGAPPDHIVSFVADVLDRVSGNLISKLLHLLTPTTWIEWGARSVLQGLASGVQVSMCTIMPRFMTPGERVAFDHYYDEAEKKWKPVGNQEDPNLPNSNGNCKNPPGFRADEHGAPKGNTDDYYDQLDRLQKDVIARKRGEDAVANLQAFDGIDDEPLSLSVIDRTDPRSLDRTTVADYISYDLGHIPLAPRLVLDRNLREEEGEDIASGIVTFTGLITGTPAELTYERGIVRIGWSMILNVTVAIFVLIIVWIGLSQIAKGFLGNKNMADWRELVPRLVLAIIAALTSYWWCSLLIDLADGISRYLAAGMRVTPADVTLVLAQSLASVFVKNLPKSVTNLVPYWGIVATFVKLGTMTISVSLMITFAMMVLMIIGQFVMRIVLLNLLIMLSPLAFAMWALPETASWGKRWLQIFMTTLWQHGLQIICFAMALWFVRLATPFGIVTNTGEGLGGTLAGAVGLDLPTEMIWALALGVMGMVVTFKLPGMMGNSIMESWVSTLGMAAMGFSKIAGFATGAMGGGGPGGALSALGAPGGGSRGFMSFGSGGPGGIMPGVGGGLLGNAIYGGAGLAMGGISAARAVMQTIAGGGQAGIATGDVGVGATPRTNTAHADAIRAQVESAGDAPEAPSAYHAGGTPNFVSKSGDDDAGTGEQPTSAAEGVGSVSPVTGDKKVSDEEAQKARAAHQAKTVGDMWGSGAGETQRSSVDARPNSDEFVAWGRDNYNHNGMGGTTSLGDAAMQNEEAKAISKSLSPDQVDELSNGNSEFFTENRLIGGRPAEVLMRSYTDGNGASRTEPATLEQSNMVGALGVDRANHIFNPNTDSAGAGSARQAVGDVSKPVGRISRIRGAANAGIGAFKQERADFADRYGERLFQNRSNPKEIISENQQGSVNKLMQAVKARGGTGRDIEDAMARQTKYVGHGDYSVDRNGRFSQLTESQDKFVRNLSPDDFRDNMRYDTTVAKNEDGAEGGYVKTQWRDGEKFETPVSQAEREAIDNAGGSSAYNSAFRGRHEYQGNVSVVQDLKSGHQRVAENWEEDYLKDMGMHENGGRGTPGQEAEVNKAMGTSWDVGGVFSSSGEGVTRDGSPGQNVENTVGRGVGKGARSVGNKLRSYNETWKRRGKS